MRIKKRNLPCTVTDSWLLCRSPDTHTSLPQYSGLNGHQHQLLRQVRMASREYTLPLGGKQTKLASNLTSEDPLAGSSLPVLPASTPTACKTSQQYCNVTQHTAVYRINIKPGIELWKTGCFSFYSKPIYSSNSSLTPERGTEHHLWPRNTQKITSPNWPECKVHAGLPKLCSQNWM